MDQVERQESFTSATRNKMEQFQLSSSVAPVHGIKFALDSRTHISHRFLWTIITLGSTGLAIYSATSIYMTWQEAPVLTTFGSDMLPIHSLEFPSIILCSPGNNMKALPNVSLILNNEWKEYWSIKNKTILDQFETLEYEQQESLLTEFVMNQIPGWPEELTLKTFMLHMTTHLPALRQTLLLWKKEPEYRDKDVPVFDLLLNPDRYLEAKAELEKIDQSTVELFRNIDFQNVKHREVMMSVLWFTAQPCRQLIILCKWKGQRVPCEQIFFTIPTDIGFCCAFNHNTLREMLRGETLARILENIEVKYDQIMDTQTVHSANYSDAHTDFTPNWGIQNGLTVVLDTMSDYNPASVRQDFLGVQAAIKGKNQFPIISRDSFLIKPGHETYIAITATHTAARENLRALPIEKRKCYYQDELELQLFNTYSVKNCWMESLTNFSRKQNPNGCVPWNFPAVDEGMPPCRPLERHKFLHAFRTAETNAFVEGGMARCLPNCGGTSYDISVTSAPFRKCDQANMGLTRLCDLDVMLNTQKYGDLILDSYRQHGNGSVPEYISSVLKSKIRKFPVDKLFGNMKMEEDHTYDAFENDISVATFYFPRHTAMELVKGPKMSLLDFLSQVGGILGLCVGISLISVIEMLYWFFVELAKKTKEILKPTRMDENATEQ